MLLEPVSGNEAGLGKQRTALIQGQDDSESPEVIRFDDLEPVWYLPRAKEPGFMRWLVTWLGGPPGYINPSRGLAAENEKMAVGYMSLPVGQQQSGLHAHTVTEIYIVLAGQLLGWDGRGESHLAGPGDCVYIPRGKNLCRSDSLTLLTDRSPGVPHGVRCYGNEDAELIWLHDGVEIKGAVKYFEGPGPFPQDDDIRIVKGDSLSPNWSCPKAKEPEFMRWLVDYVAGQHGYENYNPMESVHTTQIRISMKHILPWQREVPYESDDHEISVVLSGKPIVSYGKRKGLQLGRLDAIYYRDGASRGLKNHCNTTARILTVTVGSVRHGSTRYITES